MNKKIISVLLGAALVIEAPGLGAYRAFAQSNEVANGAERFDSSSMRGPIVDLLSSRPILLQGVQEVIGSGLLTNDLPARPTVADLNAPRVQSAAVHWSEQQPGLNTHAVAVVHSLLAHRDVLAQQATGLREVLGETHFQTLLNAAVRSTVQKEHILTTLQTEHSFDPTNAAAVAAFERKLDQIYDLETFQGLEADPVFATPSAEHDVALSAHTTAASPAALSLPSPSANGPAAATPRRFQDTVRAIFSAAWKEVRAFFTLDFSPFNRSEKAYIIGQSVFVVALSVYIMNSALMVKVLTGSTEAAGFQRAVHYATFAFASLFAGSVVKDANKKYVLVGGGVLRAALFGAIGVLALFHHLSWRGFLGLVAANALVVAHSSLMDITLGGAPKIFQGASDEETTHKINKAKYLFQAIKQGLMILVPLVMGVVLDLLNARFGPVVQAGSAFVIFAAVMVIASAIYGMGVFPLKQAVTESHAIPARAGLNIIEMFFAGSLDWAPILKKLTSAPKALMSKLLHIFILRNLATLKVIFQNATILARWAMNIVEQFIEDAMAFVILPVFALDVLHANATQLGSTGTALALGTLCISLFVKSKIQGLEDKHGLIPVLTWLTGIAALAFVPSIGMWAAPSLGMTLVAVFMMRMMLQPLSQRMNALLTSAINDNPQSKPFMDDIYSLMNVFETAALVGGGILFEHLFAWSKPGGPLARFGGELVPMKVVTMTLVLLGAIAVWGLQLVKKQHEKELREKELREKALRASDVTDAKEDDGK